MYALEIMIANMFHRMVKSGDRIIERHSNCYPILWGLFLFFGRYPKQWVANCHQKSNKNLLQIHLQVAFLSTMIEASV